MTQDAVMVEAKDLAKVYARGAEKVEALKGVDLSLPRGAMAAVTGESGSGKTTLLNLLACVDRPTSGTLRIAGAPLEGLPERALTDVRRRVIGFVFQEFSLLPGLTVEANVGLPLMFGRRAAGGDGRRRVADLLERVGLTHRARFRPRDLSGGEMQRAAVARALVRGPQLLLADEPTGNLDSRNAEAVFGLFRELNERDGLTVIVATHNADLAARCPVRLHLADGRLEVG